MRCGEEERKQSEAGGSKRKKKQPVKQRKGGGDKRRELHCVVAVLLYAEPWQKPWGLLSVVTLKGPSVTNSAGKRGHFPLRWPTLLNPASANTISIGGHYDRHINKAITFHGKERNSEIKDVAGEDFCTLTKCS